MRAAGGWTIGLVVAAAVAIGLWRLLTPDSGGEETSVAGSPDPTASCSSSPALAGSRSPGQPSQQVSDRTLGLFRSGGTQLRRTILQDLLHAGIYDARLVPVLKSMLADATLDERTRFLAQTMFTRASGDESHLRALAETTLRDPQQYRAILEECFGDSLDVLLLAATRKPSEGQPIDDDLALHQAFRSPQVLRETVRLTLRDADGARLAWALEFGRAFRPPPDELEASARRALVSEDLALLRETLRILARPGWSAAPDWDALAAAVAQCLMRSPGLTSLALDALSSLHRGGTAVQQALLLALRDGSTRSQALRTIESLGPLVAECAPSLVAWASGVDEVDRIPLDRAVASLGSLATVPYLDARLRAGDQSECVAILERLSATPASVALVPVVKEFASHPDTRAGRAALVALVHIDPGLEQPGTESVLLIALRANEVATQLAALTALRSLEAPGGEMARTTFVLLRSVEPEVVRNAAVVIRAWGVHPATWPILRDLAQAACRADSGWPPEAAGVGLEFLARIDPSAPAIRERLAVALSAKRAIAERLGALRGYAFVKDPTASEARLVAAQLGTNELIDPASEVLELPAWAEVVDRNQIFLMVQSPPPFR